MLTTKTNWACPVSRRGCSRLRDGARRPAPGCGRQRAAPEARGPHSPSAFQQRARGQPERRGAPGAAAAAPSSAPCRAGGAWPCLSRRPRPAPAARFSPSCCKHHRRENSTVSDNCWHHPPCHIKTDNTLNKHSVINP